MKIAIASLAGLVIITTAIFAQRPDRKSEQGNDTLEYIKKETIGGKLDFTAVLQQPDDFPIEHNGVRFNKNDYYVFLWGKAVTDMGLESTDDAARLWEKIHGKKLTNPQRTALKIGFEKQLK